MSQPALTCEVSSNALADMREQCQGNLDPLLSQNHWLFVHISLAWETFQGLNFVAKYAPRYSMAIQEGINKSEPPVQDVIETVDFPVGR